MSSTVTKLLIPGRVGPAELAAGRTYVHDAELDGDEDLQIGTRVEICDEAGRMLVSGHRHRPRRGALAADDPALRLEAYEEESPKMARAPPMAACSSSPGRTC